jgi:hypothetical protein
VLSISIEDFSMAFWQSGHNRTDISMHNSHPILKARIYINQRKGAPTIHCAIVKFEVVQKVTAEFFGSIGLRIFVAI